MINISMIFDFTILFVEFFITYSFFKGFLGKRNVSLWLLVCYATVFVPTPILLELYAGSFIIKAPIAFMLIFLLSLMFEGNLKLKLFASSMFFVLLFISDLITVFIMTWTSGNNLDVILNNGLLTKDDFKLVALIISKLTLLLISKIVGRLRKKDNRSMPFQYWLSIVAFPIISIFIVFVNFDLNCKVSSVEITTVSFGAMIGVLYINFFAFQLFEVFAEKTQKDLKERLLKNQVYAQIKECERLQYESISKRSFLHDLRHHNQLLFDLVKKGNADKALELISKMLELNENQNEYVNTGNSALNALFNTHLGYAESQGIRIDVDNIHLPEDIELEIEDICIIFANSLENAIEACKKVNRDKRFIKIALKYRDYKLVYKITNSTDGNVIKDKNGCFKSTKTSRGEHGIGLENIEKAVDKYGGVFTSQHNDNIFTLGFSISFLSHSHMNKKERISA